MATVSISLLLCMLFAQLKFSPLCVADYVTIVSPFPSTDTEFTLALWLSTEVTNDGTWHAFIGYQNGGVCPGRSPSMWVARFEGLHWDSCQSGTRYAGVLQNYFPVAEVNVYQHVVWTKRGSNYYFYKAGDLYSPGGTQPAATNVQLSDNYWVGHVDNYFIGTIDEVGIFDFGLSDDDVKAFYIDTATQGGNTGGDMVDCDGDVYTPLAGQNLLFGCVDHQTTKCTYNIMVDQANIFDPVSQRHLPPLFSRPLFARSAPSFRRSFAVSGFLAPRRR